MRGSQIFMGLFIFGILMISGCSGNTLTGDITNPKENTVLTGEVKEFKIEAFQFGFDPSVIEVNQGDKVRIIASSRDVPHGLVIPEFGVNLYLDGLNEQTAEFIADKTGTFAFYCSVPCGSGHGRMNGKLIVR